MEFLKKNSIFFLNIFFKYFLKRIRCSKYKQQGIVKVLIRYKIRNLQCSFFKIATCEAVLINTKILSFWKKLKTMHHTKNPMNQNILFHILHLSSKIQSLRFNNKKNSKTVSVPLINNTNELIRKILSEQLHNQIIYAS